MRQILCLRLYMFFPTVLFLGDLPTLTFNGWVVSFYMWGRIFVVLDLDRKKCLDSTESKLRSVSYRARFLIEWKKVLQIDLAARDGRWHFYVNASPLWLFVGPYLILSHPKYVYTYLTLQGQIIFQDSFRISFLSRKKSKLQRKRCDRTPKLRLLYPLKPLLSRYFHKLPQRKVHDTWNKKGFSKSKYGLTIFFLNAHIFGGGVCLQLLQIDYFKLAASVDQTISSRLKLKATAPYVI